MALPTEASWAQLSAADIQKILSTPLALDGGLLERVRKAETEYINETVRRALCLWVSELEPVLMYHWRETRPFGITAKGHNIAYVEIGYDSAFYLAGESRRYPVQRRS